MKLKLERPLAFIDIESTGLNRESDRIVEISICILHPDLRREIKTRRLNPGIPISEEATAVHGITNDDVKAMPDFKQVAKGLMNLITGCDIAGFGSNNYDVPLLYNEFLRAGIEWDYTKHFFIDAGNLFKIMEPRDLTAALKFYCNKDHEGAHGAEADVNATVDVFLAQVERYEVPEHIGELALMTNYDKILLDLSGKFTFNDKGQVVFTFGPNRWLPAEEHLDFVTWMLERDFPPDTHRICRQLVNGETVF